MPSKGVLPPASSLSTLPATDLSTILSLLFEPSPALTSLITPLIHAEPTDSYPQLISLINSELHRLSSSPSQDDQALLLSILSAHPRLGEKKISSAQSLAEQATLRSGASHPEQQEAAAAAAEANDDRQTQIAEDKRLADLNRSYEERFPGLRYVVFVNGRPRDVIVADMEARIARGTLESEKRTAIDAMCDIARDRARKLEMSEL